MNVVLRWISKLRDPRWFVEPLKRLSSILSTLVVVAGAVGAFGNQALGFTPGKYRWIVTGSISGAASFVVLALKIQTWIGRKLVYSPATHTAAVSRAHALVTTGSSERATQLERVAEKLGLAPAAKATRRK